MVEIQAARNTVELRLVKSVTLALLLGLGLTAGATAFIVKVVKADTERFRKFNEIPYDERKIVEKYDTNSDYVLQTKEMQDIFRDYRLEKRN